MNLRTMNEAQRKAAREDVFFRMLAYQLREGKTPFIACMDEESAKELVHKFRTRYPDLASLITRGN